MADISFSYSRHVPPKRLADLQNASSGGRHDHSEMHHHAGPSYSL